MRGGREGGGELVERGDELLRLVFEALRRAGAFEVVGCLVDEVGSAVHALEELLERSLPFRDLRQGEVHTVARRDDGLRVVLLGDRPRAAAATRDNAGGDDRCTGQ